MDYSDTDSDSSDSDDLYVYKKSKVVKWSDDDDSDDDEKLPPPTCGEGRSRDADEGISPSAKRPRNAQVQRPPGSGARGGEGSSATAGSMDRGADFLAPPPSTAVAGAGGGRSSGSSRRVKLDNLDSRAQEAIRRNREALAELQRAATEDATPLEDEDDVEVVGDVGPGRVGASSQDAGAEITIYMQLKSGERLEHTCRDGETFSKILDDFFASDAGFGAKALVGKPPKIVFDGEVVDAAKQTPKHLDMEDQDMVDLL